MADYVDSRRVGDATVTAIYDATDGWAPGWQAPEAEWRAAMPEADADGEMAFDTNVFHVRLGDASVLIDLGHGDAPERYMKQPPDRRSPGVIAGLATIGVRPEDVTHVVITHAHGDHFMGATAVREGRTEARLPRARYLIGRAEWEGNAARDRPGSAEAEELGALSRLGLLELVEGHHEIAPGIDMLPSPGESPGHSIVRVESRGERFYCLGDLFHHTCEVEHLDWVPAGRDLTATYTSRTHLIAEAVPAHALLAFTHAAFPCWGRIVTHGSGGFRWERA